MAGRKVSPLMVLPPILFAALAAMFYFGMQRDDPNSLPSTLIGKQAPAFPTETLPNQLMPDADMIRDGQVTLVNFWATWCPPCRAEHPKLLEMASQGIRIIGVNFKDEGAKATAYLSEEGNPFMAVGYDPQGRAAINWGVTGPPETFIVAGDGTVLYRFTGPLVGSDFEQRFLPELQKAQAAQ
jgi:cytochrome c biogenesis protein CcmG/thiol:disulfide interchange protein DsbE